jgi:NAD(P)-dependent dehydrogenase (short-subunit alcohol dehydrogenase family)
MHDLAGKTALVTGASSGLGLHFAEVLARHGARVVLAARNSNAIGATAKRIVAEGGKANAIAMDVTDTASLDKAFAELSVPLDIVVNNAGISLPSSAMEMTEADFSRVVDTNLTGVFSVAQRAARLMRDNKTGGSIINVASILGFRVAGHVAAYAASKAAVVQLSKALALEWARYGIRVNALCPGYIETPINRDFFVTDQGKALINRIPQRRLGTPHDLDGPLLLLCSDASRYMTGSALVVDGGHLVSSL